MAKNRSAIAGKSLRKLICDPLFRAAMATRLPARETADFDDLLSRLEEAETQYKRRTGPGGMAGMFKPDKS
ncbi:hypothetical protein [Phyllobacterium lublinensis]|uniref:hypothetical protein n=1 Tax=Phyllobacterium lublinensis TaxID=2875708 RepID=UPI001CCA7A66|nr:hypothetical protein [Phyllobacterium sp. 2063]MBZ9653671.1 hypothetical protein [Phyllobacterium sp. 2063]